MVRNQREEPYEGLPFSGETVANGTSAATLGAAQGVQYTLLAPAGVTTSTLAKWLRINDDGTEYFIPLWT